MTRNEKLIPVPYVIESSQTTTARIQFSMPGNTLDVAEVTNNAGPVSLQRASSAWRSAHERMLDEYSRAWEILAS